MRRSHFSRRQFLKRATTASVGALSFPYFVPSSVLGKGGAVAPSNRIVMGCIGVGGQGTGIMRRFMADPEVQVIAVCDVERGGEKRNGRDTARQGVEKHYAEKAESGTYKGCASYGDFRELVARPDIDAVTVCTPDHWHALASIAAANAGKDIYCEKPLANSVAEGRAICDAVARNKRVLQTGSHERSNGSARFGAELVRNGRIGKVHTVRINLPVGDGHHQEVMATKGTPPEMPVPATLDYDFWLGHTAKVPYTEKRVHFWWRFILAYGGGEMTDRGAHVIDLAQLALGTDDTGPVEFVAKGKKPEPGLYDAFMEYKFECKYASGIRMIGESAGDRGVKFEGDNGWLFIHVHGGKLEAEKPSLLEEKIGPNEINLGRSPGHQRDFLDCVKSRKQPMAAAEIGHRTASLCHLLNIAMLTERKLAWDPKKEQIANDPEANKMLKPAMRAPWKL